MALALHNSYETVLKQIKTTGSVWIQTPQTAYQKAMGIPPKWFKTFDKQIVQDRIATIQKAMVNTLTNDPVIHSSFKEPSGDVTSILDFENNNLDLFNFGKAVQSKEN